MYVYIHVYETASFTVISAKQQAAPKHRCVHTERDVHDTVTYTTSPHVVSGSVLHTPHIQYVLINSITSRAVASPQMGPLPIHVVYASYDNNNKLLLHPYIEVSIGRKSTHKIKLENC